MDNESQLIKELRELREAWAEFKYQFAKELTKFLAKHPLLSFAIWITAIAFVLWLEYIGIIP